jgi:SAM-dependent methyltransferase
MANTDLFSVQADDYARFRPTYPDALFNYLSTLCRERETVWDCATGSGQAALSLTKYFERVIGTDISQALLDKAEKHAKITYKETPAENTGLENHSIDLVTVAQALHWFEYDKFFPEVKRVLKPGGIFAAWGYTHLHTDAPVQKLTDYVHNDLLKEYWAPQIGILNSRYADIPFPFEPIEPPRFEINQALTFEQLIGYMVSWSATQKFIKEKGQDELQRLFGEIRTAWGDLTQMKPVRWEVFMKVGKA